MRALAVDRLVVFARDRRGGAIALRSSGDPRLRRPHQRALDRPRRAARVEQLDQRLAGAKLGDRRRDVEPGIGPEGLGGRLDAAVVLGGEGAQRVLEAIAELAGDVLGDIARILGDEEDPDPLGADQPHDLLDLVDQRPGRVLEQQVRLVEEEDQLRLGRIADLGSRSNSSDSSQSRKVA